MVAKTEFQASELRWVYIPEALILLCMLVCLVLAMVFIVLITVHAPELFHSQDVNSTMFLTGILLMAFGVIVGGMGLRRTSAHGLAA